MLCKCKQKLASLSINPDRNLGSHLYSLKLRAWTLCGHGAVISKRAAPHPRKGLLNLANYDRLRVCGRNISSTGLKLNGFDSRHLFGVVLSDFMLLSLWVSTGLGLCTCGDNSHWFIKAKRRSLHLNPHWTRYFPTGGTECFALTGSPIHFYT